MFLKRLNEPSRLSFLSIATALAGSDGFFSGEEQSLMNQYAQELGIETLSEVPTSVEVDREIAHIADLTSLEEKRVILIELIALANADARFASEEESLLKKVAQAFGVDLEEYHRCIELLDQYMTSCSALVNYIDGGL